MPIEEKAINGVLAEVLFDRGVHAVPEERRKGARKRCDIKVYPKDTEDVTYFTAIECKIGQKQTNLRNAIKSAQRWLKDPTCWNAIALCYPDAISQRTHKSLKDRLENSSNLKMAQVDHEGVVDRWRLGNVSDLVNLSNDVGTNETYAITDILKRAIDIASRFIPASTSKKLADALELPYDEKKQGGDLRPAKVACLIIANMTLIQNQMTSLDVPVSDLETLSELRESSDIQKALLNNWAKIRSVDYAPVVDPAIAMLALLPSTPQTKNLLRGLLNAVSDCSQRIRGLQLDHAGPLYHSLLDTAKYDGSFYTSTAAAVLLAELAMPMDWLGKDGWGDINKISKLKVCDPACGTGTLLMATAKTIEDRYHRAAKNINKEDVSCLHLNLIEDVLHGMDINRHGINLAASMLTLSAPRIDYNKMNLYNMHHGINDDGVVRAGSMDILLGNAGHFPYLTDRRTQGRTTGSGYKEEKVDLEGQCDLVIMNPPFTRNDIRNKGMPKAEADAVKKHETYIAKKAPNEIHRAAIDDSAASTFFTPIADSLLNNHGTVATILPTTVCTTPSGKGHRMMFNDTDRFNLDVVITSHDNRRICFSENTKIRESIFIARRPGGGGGGDAVAFISLNKNPSTPSDAVFLARSIQDALRGENRKLRDYGNIVWRTKEKLREKPWNVACFLDPFLADAYDELFAHERIVPLDRFAAVGPAGQDVRGVFEKVARRQTLGVMGLWHHNTSCQKTMHPTPDSYSYLAAKDGKQHRAVKLWERRGHLLIANRFRINKVNTPAVFSEQPVIGSAFSPVRPQGADAEEISKALCVWLNSTFGVLCFLNIRQKDLTYSHFSLDSQKKWLLVPNPKQVNLSCLARVYDDVSREKLESLPEITKDRTRKILDDAVCKAITNLPDVGRLREFISMEPTVHNRKEPFISDSS